jgi:hypothetical protein
MSLDHDADADLVEAAIRREMDVLGDEQAVTLAREIGGLAVAEDGSVTAMERPGTAILEELVDVYVEASGDVAAFVIARRLANMVEDADRLPENVGRHI